VNGKEATLQKHDYRFLQALRSLDPVGYVNEGYKITSLPSVEIPTSHEDIHIHW